MYSFHASVVSGFLTSSLYIVGVDTSSEPFSISNFIDTYFHTCNRCVGVSKEIALLYRGCYLISPVLDLERDSLPFCGVFVVKTLQVQVELVLPEGAADEKIDLYPVQRG